jgi:hypothetical protein
MESDEVEDDPLPCFFFCSVVEKKRNKKKIDYSSLSFAIITAVKVYKDN